MIKNLIPTKNQWKKWTLPSKASYFSAWFGVFAFAVSLLLQFVQIDAIKNLYEAPNWKKIDQSVKINFSEEFDKDGDLNVDREWLSTHVAFIKSRCKNDYKNFITDILAIRIASVAATRIDFYRSNRSDLYKFKGNTVSIFDYLINEKSELIGEFSEGVKVAYFYKNIIESMPDSEIENIYNHLISRHDQTEYSWSKGIELLNKIPSHKNPCLKVDTFQSGMDNLDMWLKSFWIRRHNDGTIRVLSEAMDIYLQKYR